MQPLGRLLIIVGLLTAFVGVLFLIGGKIPYVGKLPGDILIKRDRFTFYFPVVTCLVLSLILTILFRLFGHK